ncbi:hypothetical protein [uncultured Limosilactobacillus sp.]|uniref:hypothetical protein n=1 Tax=uncultured Limosilactobacillus sp. TaxID=2837629 RepID=UPI0025F998AD|nr:hypothetical protein [uncultured Limosilactobacillus sp.]
MSEQHHYIQPHNVHEAMVLIQKLFNEYRHAPLTEVLLNYHNNLITRLRSDIYETAVQEGNSEQLHNLKLMIQAMETWTKIRLNRQPFNGKMKNFRLVINQHPHFRHQVHKISSQRNHRASRH